MFQKTKQWTTEFLLWDGSVLIFFSSRLVNTWNCRQRRQEDGDDLQKCTLNKRLITEMKTAFSPYCRCRFLFVFSWRQNVIRPTPSSSWGFLRADSWCTSHKKVHIDFHSEDPNWREEETWKEALTSIGQQIRTDFKLLIRVENSFFSILRNKL